MEERWVYYGGGAVQDWHRRARRMRVEFGVTVIPENAFEDCDNLKAVDLGNVATISVWAFNGCRSLERVVWTTASAVEIGGWAFAGCVGLEEIDLHNATKIRAHAFSHCVALKHVTIPSTATAIEDSTFHACRNLAEVELGDGILRIGKKSFWGCNSLVRISIPPSVTVIEDSAFECCDSLAEVELSEGLQHIGKNAFLSCKSLLRISIPSTAVKIGGCAFRGCNQLRHAELQEGLQMIGEGAFDGCCSLERITIPPSVKTIYVCAFNACNRLSEVTLCEGIIEIGSHAFHPCTSLARINIPSVALVIDIEQSSCQLLRAVMPNTPGRKLIASKWMQYRSPAQLAHAEAKVNQILGRRRQTECQKVTLIREWFAYFDLLDVTTMLELAIWRCNMDGNEDAEARLARRRACGNDMNVIIPGVLPYLGA